MFYCRYFNIDNERVFYMYELKEIFIYNMVMFNNIVVGCL